MKKIIKISLLALAAYCTGGCTSKFEEYNTDHYSTYTLPPALGIRSMINAMTFVQQNNSQMVDQMVGSLGGYFTLSNRWGGQNFDTFNASDSWNAIPFSLMFEGVYTNFLKIEEDTKKSGHWYALANLVRAAVMMRVADCYGPIPYSKVSRAAIYAPYDSAEDVYKSIITDLQNAASVLYAFAQDYPGVKPFEASDPTSLHGDYALWAKLANSLILRAAMRSGDREAFEYASSHPAGVIESNSQNAMRDPGVEGNPYQLASASWGDLRLNSSIVDYMNGYTDPRRAAYFQFSTFAGNTTRYIGMRSGEAGFAKDAVAGYSLPNIQAGDMLPLFLAAETNFLRAEAALNGWAVAGTAREYYEAGVRLSMQQYGVSESDIATYLADDTSTPASHTGDPRGTKYNYDRTTSVKIKWNEGDGVELKRERIITQKWIANFPMGIEAWAEFRRTGYPQFAPAIDNLSGGVITDNFRGMRRLRYPYTERNLNRANYDAAVSAFLGGRDNESVDLFWAKK